MKSRILRELHELSIGSDHGYRQMLKADLPKLTDSKITELSKRYLTELLNDYSGFKIQTIDGFFQQLVRAFSREIGLAGGYQIDLDSEKALEKGVDNLLSQLDKKEHKNLLAWLTAFSEERIEDGKYWEPRMDIIKLAKEIFKETYAANADSLNEKLNEPHFLSNYKSALNGVIKAFEEKITDITNKANAIIVQFGLEYGDFNRGKTGFISHFNSETLKNKEYLLTNTFIINAANVENWYTKTSKKKAEIEGAYQQGLGNLAVQLVNLTDEDSCQLKDYISAKVILKNLYVLGILSDIVKQVNEDSKEDNRMLINNTTDFLKRIIQDSETPFIYEKTGVTIDHYMIDEFQDTSRMQWENFIPLLHESVSQGNDNLIVGDVKQSIYRFRNSDWHILHEDVDQIFGQNVETNHLETNYRSDHRVIEFNNNFFEETINSLSADFPGKEEEVKKVYSALKQYPRKEDQKGTIAVNFYQESKESSWKEQALTQLGSQVQALLLKGYQYHDMAVLTRTGEEATEVATFLLEQGHEVLSNEALVIQSAPSVQLLLATMRYLKRPTDDYNRALFTMLYQRVNNPQESIEKLHNTISAKNVDYIEWETTLFGPEKAAELQQIRHFPLFKMAESLVVWLSLQNQKLDIPFIQAFQDHVHHYANEVSSDINIFLNYWEEKGAKNYISAPEGQNAIRIMTIHKSKGLEFNVVFIPFCDWSFTPKSSIFWAQPQTKPFNALELLPLNYSDKLMRSWFRDDYLSEKLNYYLDTLNVAYVAFTRACKALYIGAPYKEDEKSKKFSQLMLNYLTNTKEWDVESLCYSIGEIDTRESKSNAERLIQDEYISDKIDKVESRLKLRFKNQDHWEIVNESPLQSQRLFGNIMHELLEHITTKEDIEQALHEFLSQGIITEKEVETLRSQLQEFFKIPETEDWFSGNYRVLREAEIITPQGMTYRPDRVMLQGERVVIVDYKFGTHEESVYHKQVSNYMELVKQMGYHPEGYICYAMLNKVEKVEPHIKF